MIWIGAGAVSVVATIVIFTKLGSASPGDQNTKVSRMFAKNTGLSGDTLLKMMQIQDKMRANQPISEEEMTFIETQSKSTALEFRSTSLTSLAKLENTQYKDRAHEILRRLAKDPDPNTGAMAITTLTYLKDPASPSLVAYARSSSDPVLKHQAELIDSHQVGNR